MDMVAYLQSKGEDFDVSGAYYRNKTHDSLVICPSKGYYVWNSRSGEERENRSCINLAKAFYNLSFIEAVTDILEHRGYRRKETAVQVQEKQSFDYDRDVHEMGQTAELKAYLVGNRRINAWLVSELIEKGYLAEDTQRNVIFKWHDPIEKEKIVGANLEGTWLIPPEKRTSPVHKRFKKILTTGDYGYYFDVGKTRDIDKIYFFEAPVDALSFLTLKIDEGSREIQNARFFSMNGLKLKTLLKNYRLLEERLNRRIEAHICVDNDAAGHHFFEDVRDYSFVRSGKDMLVNEIPYDLVLPKKLASFYRKVGEQAGIDWTWLAAIRKVETNFAHEGGAGEPDIHARQNVKEATLICADLLSKNTGSNGQVQLRQVIGDYFKAIKDKTEVFQYEPKIRYYHNAYNNSWVPVAETIPKDWNDLLVAKNIQETAVKIDPQPQLIEGDAYVTKQHLAQRLEVLEEER
ncbi:DUF3991 domain-containing protein [Sporolactobacillus sp. KGMB 08714]|uniref:DUF3991 domain-containing protein n=1 Tax=Sporolactobacillus sp. KGMB 08714 TaxID=3064704 RepID=UPI002FBE120D